MDNHPEQTSARGQSPPFPHTTAGSSAYQVNVNRTKTKKWVEAKVQSYDGDDWGADQYVEDEARLKPEPIPPLPMSNSSIVTTNRREPDLPSLQTSSPLVKPAQTELQKSASPSGKDALGHIHNRVSQSNNPHGQSSRQTPTTDDIIEHYTTTAGASAGLDVADSSSGQERKAEMITNSTPNTTTLIPTAVATPLRHHIESDFMKKSNLSDSGVQEKTPVGKSEFTSAKGGNDGTQPQRLSSSPKLPDVARMSAFGSDFFSPNAKILSTNHSDLKHRMEDKKNDHTLSHPFPSDDSTKSAETQFHSSSTPAENISKAVQTRVENVKQKEAYRVDSPDANDRATSAPCELDSLDQPTNPQLEGTAPASVLTSPLVLRKDSFPVLRPGSDVHEIAPLRTPSPRSHAHKASNVFDIANDDRKSDGRATEHQKALEQDFDPTDVPNASQATTHSTTSSTLKDNDKLSDEILKSLTPTRQGGLTQRTRIDGTNQSPDSFNNRTDNHGSQDSDSRGDQIVGPKRHIDGSMIARSVTDRAESRALSTFSSEAGHVGDAAESSSSPQSETLRRQFSWEGGERRALSQLTRTEVEDSSASDVEEVNLRQEISPIVNLQPTHAQGKPEAVSPSPASEVSQTPSGSKRPIEQQIHGLGASSPISPDNGQNAAVSSTISRPHDANEDALPQSGLLSMESTPSPKDQATSAGTGLCPFSLSDPTVADASHKSQPQIMTFREIMNLGDSGERIAKYNESRDIFLATDSGLEKWLLHVRAQHQDLSAAAPHINAQAATSALNAGPQNVMKTVSTQQPYYQQYLNANPPNASGTATSRSRLAAISVPSQMSSSNFGHSGNQIGNKGKELMQSAGKMGKGLLSKGRNKLRGTGDKGETLASVDEPQVKTGRRASWALSLGLKSREMDAPQIGATRRPSPTSAQTLMAPEIPQIPLTAPLLPIDTASRLKFIPEWRHSAPENVSTLLNAGPHVPALSSLSLRSDSASRAKTGLSKLESPMHSLPISSETQSISLMPQDRSPKCRHATDNESVAPTLTTKEVDHDWVVVPRDAESVRFREESLDKSGAPVFHGGSVLPAGLASDAIGTLPAQKGLEMEEPKRSPSFIGLPPIRRGSTFALKSKPKDRNAVEKSLVDDDGDALDSSIVVDSLVPGTDSIMHPAPQSLQSTPHGQNSSSTAVFTTEREFLSSLYKDCQFGAIASADEVVPETSRIDANKPAKSDLRLPTSSLAALPVDAHDQDLVQPAAFVQQLPIPGPWKLEESKLSRPLNPVSRNRSGTPGAVQQTANVIDMKVDPPHAQSAKQSARHLPDSTASPLPQQDSSVPSSSAQRWPELFANADNAGSKSKSRGDFNSYQPPYHTAIAARMPIVPKPHAQGHVPAGANSLEEGHDHKSRNSTLLQDLGKRFVAAAARDDGESPNPQGLVAGPRSDMAPQSSAIEGTGTRHGFLFGRSRRLSNDQREKDILSHIQDHSAQGLASSAFPFQTNNHQSYSEARIFGRYDLLDQARTSESPSQVTGQDTTRESSPGNHNGDAIRETVVRGKAKIVKLLGRRKRETQVEDSTTKGVGGSTVPLVEYHGRSNLSDACNAAFQTTQSEVGKKRRSWRPSVTDLMTEVLGKETLLEIGKASDVEESQTSLSVFKQPCHSIEDDQTSHCHKNAPPQDVSQQAVIQLSGLSRKPYDETGLAGPCTQEVSSSKSQIADYKSTRSIETSSAVLSSRDASQSTSSDFFGTEETSEQIEGTRIQPTEKYDTRVGDRASALQSHAQPSFDSGRFRLLSSLQRPGPVLEAKEQDSMRQSKTSPDLSINLDWQPMESSVEGKVTRESDEISARENQHSIVPTQPRIFPGTSTLSPPTNPSSGESRGFSSADTRRLMRKDFSQSPFPVESADQNIKPSPRARRQADAHGSPTPGILSSHRSQAAKPDGQPLQAYPPQSSQQVFADHLPPNRPVGNPDRRFPSDRPPHHLHLQQNAMQTFVQPQTVQNAQPEQGGFKWKGLTKRLSGQKSGFPVTGVRGDEPKEPNKPNKPPGSSFLNAFKKGSKRPDGSGATPNREQLVSGQQVAPSKQPWFYAQHQLQQQRANQSQIASNSPSLPSANKELFEPRYKQKAVSAEPDYDYVPIPQGYVAVHGEGTVAPTMYNVWPQKLPMRHHTVPMIPLNLVQGSPMPTTQNEQLHDRHHGPLSSRSQTHASPENYAGSLNPGPRLCASTSESSSANMIDIPNEMANFAASLGESRVPRTVPNHSDSSHQRTAQDNIQRISQRLCGAESSTQPHGNIPVAIESSDVKADVLSNAEPGLRLSSENPEIGGLHDDESDIYCATPRLSATVMQQDEVPRRISADSLLEQARSMVPIEATGPIAELEDTAYAHKRRVRQQNQEEKIWYNPEDDPNYQAPMSATSYPGQEWNPYGDADFADLLDD